MFPIPAPGAALPTGAAAGAPVPTAPAPAQAPGKKTKTPPASRKKRLKSEQGKEKALEREAVLAEKVKGREDRKVRSIFYVANPAGAGCLVNGAERAERAREEDHADVPGF